MLHRSTFPAPFTVPLQGATEGWRAAREWVAPGGGVNFDLLGELFGGAEVAVTDTARHHQGCGPCQEMRLSQYLVWWREQQQRQQQEQQQRAAGKQQGAPGEAASAAAAAAGGAAAAAAACQSGVSPQQWRQQQQQPTGYQQQQPLLYCKDWHLAAAFPSYQAYIPPPFFADDWLNEYFDATQGAVAQRGAQQQQQRQGEQAEGEPPPQQQRQEQQEQQQQQGSRVAASDYRFVYMGPQAGGGGTACILATPTASLAPALP